MNETILIVDDEESIRASLSGVLEDEGYRPVCAADGVEAVTLAKKELPDLVLLDIWMPRLDGIETLQSLKELAPELLVVMMSGHGTIETAVKSTKMGAYDFIEKPLSLEKVILTVKNALGMSRLREENVTLRGIVLHDHELVGSSDQLAKIREEIGMVGPATAPVLITGENGSGRELVARAIHSQSPRRERPFVEINCSSIPGELLDAEIFGHERGALSGIAAQKKGKIDLADGGTLFLTEVGDIPLASQARLLRFLQERKFERIGGTRSLEADVRVIAATNRNLADEVRAGRFREDLFYRLNVIPLAIPALRERPQDIPLLIDHFLQEFCRKEGRERKTMIPEAVSAMQAYDWPGNVQELKNIIERLVIMTPGRTITDHHLPDYIATADIPRMVGSRGEQGEKGSLREAREDFEREFILQKLEEFDWDIGRTADAIELERSNLHRKIKSYRIDLRK